jgi:endonuclease/exonuclease/phosphatase family metal-dependent hydrolase
MSFNIRYNTAQDGDRAWPYRKERVAAHIRAYQPDVIGIQEALKGQIDDMEKLLPGYGWIGVGRIDGKEGGEFTPIFYRKDRFELLDYSTFWLSETPGTCGTKGWDASFQRTTTWCKLRDRNSGQTLFHFNTHFDHFGSRAKRESANLLLEKIKEITGNAAAVTTGDFNCGESSKAYRILTDREDPKSLQDAYYKSIPHNYGPKQTWRGFQWFGIIPKKIDFIFVKNRVQVIRHCIPNEPLHNGFISDHNPVFADILPG